MPYANESKDKKTKPTKSERDNIDDDFQLLDEVFEEDDAGTPLSDEGRACAVRMKTGSGNDSISDPLANYQALLASSMSTRGSYDMAKNVSSALGVRKIMEESSSLRQLKAIQKNPSEKSMPVRSFKFGSTNQLGKINNREIEISRDDGVTWGKGNKLHLLAYRLQNARWGRQLLSKGKKNEIVIGEHIFEPVEYDKENFDKMMQIAQTYTPDPDSKGKRAKALQDYESGKEMKRAPEHDHYNSLTFDGKINLFIDPDTDATTRGVLAGKINKTIKMINAYNVAETADAWQLSAKKATVVILVPQNIYLNGRPGVCLPAVILMGRALQNGLDTRLANNLMGIYSSSDIDADPLYKSLGDLHANGSASKFSESVISDVSVSTLATAESKLFPTENSFVRVDIPGHTLLISKVNKDGKIKYIFYDPNYGLAYFKSYRCMIKFFKEKIKQYDSPEDQTNFSQLNYSGVPNVKINGSNLDEIIDGEISQSHRQEGINLEGSPPHDGIDGISDTHQQAGKTYTKVDDNIYVEQIRLRHTWSNICGDLIPEILTRLPGFENIRLHIYRDDDTSQPWYDSIVLNPESANAIHTIRLRYSGNHYDTLLDTDQVIKIQPDGDCFFRAVLQALTPEERQQIVGRLGPDDEAISVLRNNVADWFLASPERLAYVANVTENSAASLIPESIDSGEVKISLTRTDSVSIGSGRGSPDSDSILMQKGSMRAGTEGEVLQQGATGYVLWDQFQFADALNQEGLCAGLVNSVMARLDKAPELTLLEVIDVFSRETRDDPFLSHVNMAQRKRAVEPYRRISAQTQTPISTSNVDALMAAVDLHITLGSARKVAAELRIISQNGKQDHVVALYRTRQEGHIVFDIYDPNNGAFRYVTEEAFLAALEGYVTRRGPSEMILRPLFIGETVSVTPTYPALPYPRALQPFPALDPADVMPSVSERFASVRLDPVYAGKLMSDDLLDSVQQDGIVPARLIGTLQSRDITSTQQQQQLRLLLRDIASRRPFQTEVSLYIRAFSLFEQQITYATENRLPALADELTAMLLDIHPDHIQALCEGKEGGGERYFELLEKLSRNEYTGAEMRQRIITRLVGTGTNHDINNRPLILELIVKNLRASYFSSDRDTEWPERLWSIVHHTASRNDQEQGVNRVIRLMLADRWCDAQHTASLYTHLTEEIFGKRFSLPRQLLPTDEQLRSYTGREKDTLEKKLAGYHKTAPDVLSPVDLLSEAEKNLRKILLIAEPAQRLKAASAWLLEAWNKQDSQLFNTCASALVRPLLRVNAIKRDDQKDWLEQLARLAQEPLTNEQVVRQILHTLFGAGSVLRSSINSGLTGATLMPSIWKAADNAVNRLDGARRDIMIHLLTTRYRDTMKMIFFNSGYTGYEALLKDELFCNRLPSEFIPQDALLEAHPLRNKYLNRLHKHRTSAVSVAGIPVRTQPDLFLHYYPEGDINDPLASLIADARTATFGEQLQARQDEMNVRLGAFYTTSLPVAESDFLRNDMVATHRHLLRTDLLLSNIWSAEMQEYIPPLVGRFLQCRVIIHKANGQTYSVGGKGKFSVVLTEKQGQGYCATADDDKVPAVGFFQAFLMAMPPEMKQELLSCRILDSPVENLAQQLAYSLSDYICEHPEFIDKVIEEIVPADKNELRYLSNLLSRVTTGSHDADLDVRECLYLCARVFHNGTEEDKACIISTLLTPTFISAIRDNVRQPGVATAYFGLLDIAFRTTSPTLPGGEELYTHLAEGRNAFIHAILNSANCTKTTFDVYFSLLRQAIAAQAYSEESSEEAVRHHTRMEWLAWRVYKTIPKRHANFMATQLYSAGLLPTDEEVKAFIKSKDKGWLAFLGSETSDACKRLARHADPASGTAILRHTDDEITSLGLLRYSQNYFHTSQIQAERLSRIESNAISIIQSAIETEVKSEVRRLISEQYLKAAKKLEADHPLLPEARRLADQLRTDARNPSPALVDRFSKDVAEQIFKERSQEFIPQVQQEILQHANLLPLAQTYDPEQGAMVLPRYADYIASSPVFSSIVSGLLTGAGPSEGIFHHPELLIRHPDSGPVVSDQRLSQVVTALNQQMPQYHFSMAVEQDAKLGETTSTVPVLRLRSPAPLIMDTEPDARKLTAGMDLSSTVMSRELVVETTVMPAGMPSCQTGMHLPKLPTLPPPSVASTLSPVLTTVNLRDISHVPVEAPVTKISQVMDVHGRISSGIISETVTLPPAPGESGSAVRALYPGGNVHHYQDENLRVSPVFHAGSGRNTQSGARIISLSDILPSATGGRAAERTRSDRATDHQVRQYFSEVNTILSSCQNAIKLTPENEAIRADVARRTHEVFTPDLMAAITSRHNILQETAREIIHNNNIAIVKSGQYENLIRVEGAPVDARIFSDKMQAGDRKTLDTTAHNIAKNAPAWREELRAEQEAKYLEAKRKAEEEESMRQEQKHSEEEGVKQEEKRGEEEKKDDGQHAAVKEGIL